MTIVFDGQELLIILDSLTPSIQLWSTEQCLSIGRTTTI